jgi:hypothetical protein
MTRAPFSFQSVPHHLHLRFKKSILPSHVSSTYHRALPISRLAIFSSLIILDAGPRRLFPILLFPHSSRYPHDHLPFSLTMSGIGLSFFFKFVLAQNRSAKKSGNSNGWEKINLMAQVAFCEHLMNSSDLFSVYGGWGCPFMLLYSSILTLDVERSSRKMGDGGIYDHDSILQVPCALSIRLGFECGQPRDWVD